jgi:hypothetical protein
VYESPVEAWRLDVGVLKLEPGGAGSGPDGGGAGRIGKAVVVGKPSVSFVRPRKLVGGLKLSPSLDRVTGNVELLDDRGGNMGRS